LPAFFFFALFVCAFGVAHPHAGFAAPPQQTVDGLNGALEIRARSSYVPNSPIGVRSPVSGDARPRLEMPIWMK
jgi:hypothetical protein